MTLQVIPLRERQQPTPQWGGGRQPGRSVVSEALTPQRTGAGKATGYVDMVEQQKARWAEEDKLKKLERDAKVKEAQEMGMRIRDAYEKEKAQGRAMSAQAQGQQQAAAKQIEANPEEAAKVAYEFLLSLPEETQAVLLKQIFTPIGGKSTVSAGGKTVQVGGEKYNAIAQSMLAKGQVTMDASGKPILSKPEFREGDEWYYNADDNLLYNRATGETRPIKGTKLEGVSPDLIADAFKYGSAHMGRLMNPTLLEKISPENMSLYIENARKEAQLATQNYLLGMGISKKEAKDIGDSIPIEERKTTETEPPPTGRDAPLDEEKAKGLADFLKGNPDVDLEAYRDRDGDATVDKALEIWGEKPTSTVKKTVKKKVTEEEEKKEEPKVKDFMTRIKERRGLE